MTGWGGGDPIRVLLVEDHGIVREGIRLILAAVPDVTVVADAATGAEGIALFRRHWREPGIDVVVTDLHLPDFDGLEVVRRIRAHAPQARILFLSMYRDVEHIRGLLDSGVNGYLLKQSAAQELPEAIRAVARDETFLSPAIAGALLGQVRRTRERERQAERLTGRERQVLLLLSRGITSKEIGERLSLTTKTVENYRSRILGKLGVPNTAAAVGLAFQQGLLAESSG